MGRLTDHLERRGGGAGASELVAELEPAALTPPGTAALPAAA